MKASKAAQVQPQAQQGAAPQVPGQAAPVQQPGYGQPYGYQVRVVKVKILVIFGGWVLITLVFLFSPLPATAMELPVDHNLLSNLDNSHNMVILAMVATAASPAARKTDLLKL